MNVFIPNRGQYAAEIAGVWEIPDEMRDHYHGSGPVLVRTNMQRELLAFDYMERDGDGVVVEVGDASNADKPGEFVIPAMASCFELCVTAGTAGAAVLAALDGGIRN